MNRQKYIHNPDYREGYEDGVKEAKMTVVSNIANKVDAVINDCTKLLDTVKNMVQEGESE